LIFGFSVIHKVRTNWIKQLANILIYYTDKRLLSIHYFRYRLVEYSLQKNPTMENNHQKLKDRVAIVTGADSDIGQNIAVSFAKSGANVVITYRFDEDGAKETAKLVQDAGGKVLIVRTDVGEESQVQSLFDKTLSEFKRLDILVNNPGMNDTGKLLHESSLDEWDKIIRTNLHGPFLCSKLAAKQFIKQIYSKGKEKAESQGKQSGIIINISSVHEDSALCNLTRAFALELASYGIRVIDVAPENDFNNDESRVSRR